LCSDEVQLHARMEIEPGAGKVSLHASSRRGASGLAADLTSSEAPGGPPHLPASHGGRGRRGGGGTVAARPHVRRAQPARLGPARERGRRAPRHRRRMAAGRGRPPVAPRPRSPPGLGRAELVRRRLAAAQPRRAAPAAHAPLARRDLARALAGAGWQRRVWEPGGAAASPAAAAPLCLPAGSPLAPQARAWGSPPWPAAGRQRADGAAAAASSSLYSSFSAQSLASSAAPRPAPSLLRAREGSAPGVGGAAEVRPACWPGGAGSPPAPSTGQHRGGHGEQACALPAVAACPGSPGVGSVGSYAVSLEDDSVLLASPVRGVPQIGCPHEQSRPLPHSSLILAARMAEARLSLSLLGQSCDGAILRKAHRRVFGILHCGRPLDPCMANTGAPSAGAIAQEGCGLGGVPEPAPQEPALRRSEGWSPLRLLHGHNLASTGGAPPSLLRPLQPLASSPCHAAGCAQRATRELLDTCCQVQGGLAGDPVGCGGIVGSTLMRLTGGACPCITWARGQRSRQAARGRAQAAAGSRRRPAAWLRRRGPPASAHSASRRPPSRGLRCRATPGAPP